MYADPDFGAAESCPLVVDETVLLLGELDLAKAREHDIPQHANNKSFDSQEILFRGWALIVTTMV